MFERRIFLPSGGGWARTGPLEVDCNVHGMGNAPNVDKRTGGGRSAGERAGNEGALDVFSYSNDPTFKDVPVSAGSAPGQADASNTDEGARRRRNHESGSFTWLQKQSAKTVLRTFQTLSIGARLKLFGSPDAATDSEHRTLKSPQHEAKPSDTEACTEKDLSYLSKVLVQNQLFSSFNEAELKKLATKFQRVSYSQGQVIIQEGERGDYFYVLRKGRLRIYTSQTYVLNELSSGDCFGELGLIIPTKPRSASAQCLSPCAVYRLNNVEFQRYLTANTKRLLDNARVLLQSIFPFSSLPYHELNIIARRCFFERKKKGDLLLKMGSQPSAFYVVVEGGVVITGGKSFLFSWYTGLFEY